MWANGERFKQAISDKSKGYLSFSVVYSKISKSVRCFSEFQISFKVYTLKEIKLSFLLDDYFNLNQNPFHIRIVI